MTVLVGYASAHGSTRGVAERIAARLGDQGYQVEVRTLGQVADARSYDAVVLGSAIHDQAWLPEATDFVHRNLGTLAERPVYTFSVATLGEQSSMINATLSRLLRAAGESKKITKVREPIHPRDHHAFVGALARDHYPFIGRVIFKAMGGRYGDHRNWAEIDAWAECIGHQLAAVQHRQQT